MLLGCSLFGQQYPLANWRTKAIKVEQDSFQLDSLALIPATIKMYDSVTNKELAGNYQVKYNALIISPILFEQIKNKRIRFEYRVFPYDLEKPIQHLDTMLIAKDYKGDYIGVDFTPNEGGDRSGHLFNNRALQYSGSFARGVSFGNSQNLVLNSQFNLQIAGKLGEDTEIVAALTDENIPLQAEGNTQQLQEFDKIFIQINRKNSSLTAGDYEISSREHHFMKYYKKLQGATFSQQSDVFKNAKWNTKGSFAISRGQFARNNIVAIEGNQGPYKLEGTKGEQFIIVLAGTERVYLDGQLMQRGIEADYIIDYNRGELTFTNKRLITQNSRIIIELEYLDQTFQRSLYALQSDLKTEKHHLYFSLFSQQDSKRAVGDTELSDKEITALQEAGDALQNAFVSSIDTLSTAFNEARVQYELRDTFYTLNQPNSNQLDTLLTSILIFSKNPAHAIYNAQFSLVGAGRGNYRLTLANNANGRVYEWIAPDAITGQPQGDYEPIKRLTAPEKQQLYILGSDLSMGKNARLKTEIALSNKDINRFSTLGNEDNIGTAFFADYRIKKDFENKNWTIAGQVKYEGVQKNFKSLNPYRNAEFSRDWNISNIFIQNTANEQLIKGNVSLEKADVFLFNYELSGFSRSNIYKGLKHDIDVDYEQSGYHFRLYGSLLNTDTEAEKTTFFRPRIELSKTFKKLKDWKLGFYGEREKNSITDIISDSLKARAFHWDLYRFYLENKEGQPFNWHINYTKQINFSPQDSTFLKSTIADEINLRGAWNQGRKSQLKWNFSYRNLMVENEQISRQKAQETYLGRLDYSLNLWRGGVRWNTNYEIGAGQEAKVEFQFIKVNKGEGRFVWEATEEYDLNGDSIPQINEFVIAPFQDQANYIRINTFTNDFIRTNNVILNQSLRLNPRMIWNNAAGFKKILAKFSTISNLRISRKVKLGDAVSFWNPFDLTIADTSLVSVAASIRNVLFFNRNHPIYDFQIGQFDNRNRSVLTTGFESQQHQEQFIRSRWNINPQFSNQINVSMGNRNSDSELYDNRDYDIDYQKVSTGFSYLANQQFESNFSYEFQLAENILENSQAKATFHNLKVALQYNRTQKLSFKSDFSFVNINLAGNTNPTLELTLLEGLKKGKNFLWSFTLNRQLANNVQMSLGYEGRKTGSSKIVHLGSAQVRATF